MPFQSVLRTTCLSIGILASAVSLSAQLPPRSTPADYQAQGKAGSVTIAAEFVQHSVPTPDATFTTEDYVTVETALFGAAGQKLTFTPGDFSLRVNGKKQALPSVPYGLVFKGLKNPDWEMQQAAVAAQKSKMSLGGGGDQQGDAKPSPPKMPIDVQRSMEQKVQKASFPEGDRPLPQAGFLYFEYRGNMKGVHSLELIYAGPAGKVTIPLQP
jgi:hypothetical protein